jgi:hypothetical protein
MRHVVLGLAQARSAWFRSVAAWTHSASLPIEFVKCMSAVEVRAHLSSGRPFSALLVDAGLTTLDRDLIERATEAGCAVIVVDDVRVERDWRSLGAATVVNPLFSREDLLEVLATHGREVGRADDLPGGHLSLPEPPTVSGGRVVMVCGSGGAGASSVSIALAQGLAQPPTGPRILLADLALHADQAMLHDAGDVVPGVQELVDAHRTGLPAVDELHTFTFRVDARGYQLLLGLRRARHWSAIRPRAFASALSSLTRGWDVVVCDTDADLEGEAEGGSMDVEERHAMGRTVADRADVVFAVGRPGLHGLHALVRVLDGLLGHGVDGSRIVPVINAAPKAARARAEIAAAVPALLGRRAGIEALSSPVFLPERRVDDALRDGVRLPDALTAPLRGAFTATTERAGRRDRGVEPQLITPGSLGHWSPELT